jgi:hypothetical protein
MLSLSGGKGPNVSIDNFFHWDREIVNASPWRTWEVCDNLWQEGQEETKYQRPVSTLADCQQRVPVRA